MNWYFTPDRLHAWYPDTTDVRWRCGTDKGTMLHIWWDCPLLHSFWDKVCAQIHAITETAYTWMLFATYIQLLSRYKKKTVVRHMLNAVKTIIPRHWKSTYSPKITERFSEVDSLYKMEETVAMASKITNESTQVLRRFFQDAEWLDKCIILIFLYQTHFQGLM